MEHTGRFGNHDQHNDVADDDTSEKTRDSKKSSNRSSQKPDKTEQAPRQRQAGKGLFDLLGEPKPSIGKKPESTQTEKLLDKSIPPTAEYTIEKAEVSVSDNQEQDTHKPEQLSDTEQHLVIQNLLQAEDAALKQELQQTELGSSEAAEAANVAAFIDTALNRIESGDLADEELLDEAMHSVIDDLDLVNAAGAGSDETIDDSDDEAESTPDDTHEEDPDSTTPLTPPPPGPGVGGPRPPVSPGGAGGGGGVPPPAGGGAGAAGGGRSPAGGAGGGGFPPPGAMPGAFPPMPGPPSATIVNIEAPSRHGGRRELLVGGLVGYLIGRRRGRIKTEKRLLPVQKKLEQEVKQLSDHIAVREEKIRKLTAEKHARDKADSAAQVAQAAEAKQPTKSPVKEAESQVSHNKERPLEKLGSVLVPRPEKLPDAIQEKPEYISVLPKHTPENVINVARHIDIAGQNLQQHFEQDRLSREELEHAILAYERGDQASLRRLEYRLDSNDGQSEDRFEKRSEDHAEKLKKLAAKTVPNQPAGDMPVLSQVAQDRYSPVQTINAQLAQSAKQSEVKHQSTSMLIWTVVTVGSALIIGLMLFLFV